MSRSPAGGRQAGRRGRGGARGGISFSKRELRDLAVAWVALGAAFKADYGMLFLAVMSALAGFLFAAPGAVVHRGRITARENGLIALAGPVTNIGLAAVFLPLMLFGPGLLGLIGQRGVSINLLLAGFNMIPYGPLDGKKVIGWSKSVYLAVAVPSVLLAVFALFGLGL